MKNIDLNDVKEMIIASGAEIPEGVAISADTQFEDLDLDSLDLFGLLAEIDSRYDIQIPDEAANGLICFGDVIECVNKLIIAS